MIPRAKDLRRLWFEWPESLYGRFNFQRDEHINALAEMLMGDDLPAVVVLGGEPGIGRGFLCDAAAQRARDQGHKVAVWHLDLDGFEPDMENPLTNYLRHLIDQEERHLEAARLKAKGAVKSAAKTLSTLGLVGQASEVAASLLSLLWQFEEPLSHLAEVLSRPPIGNGTPQRNDPDTLHRFLTELTQDRKLLVHVTDGPQLTSNLRRWLIREAERVPGRLLLVISCSLEQATAQAVPEVRFMAERLDVLPLNANDLRGLLDRRFEPNEFPNALVQVLMRRWHGRPAAIANQLADLMEVDLISYEDKTWRLPPAGLEDDRLVDAFSRGLFEEVDKPLSLMEGEEPDVACALREVLFLAALCGRHVPMAALLEHLELDSVTEESVIDWVDAVLVDKLGWMNDMGFHVAGFQGHNVYTFTHPLLPQVILDQEAELVREMKATSLLRFLEQRVPETRRGWARCLLSIAEHLGNRERAPYERSLAWWISLETADTLKAEVITALEREEIDPELVWLVAINSEAWPAYRRLAVLEAYSQAVVYKSHESSHVLPFDRLADFHLLRARLLVDDGKYSAALDDSLHALKLISGEPLMRSHALNLSGVARLNLGDARAAQADFEAALALRNGFLSEDNRETLMVMNNLAGSFSALGDFVDAKKLYEKVLDIQEQVLGEYHVDVATAKSNLAGVLAALGNHAEARELHQQCLVIRERILGAEHFQTLIASNNLATTLYTLGDFDGAKKLHKHTLEIQQRVLGNEHPNTLTSINNLALIHQALGDFAGAKKFHDQALKIILRVLGTEHPMAMVARNNLAMAHYALGELDEARKISEHNQEICERVLGSKHPNTSLATWFLLKIVRMRTDPGREAQLINQLRWLLDSDEDSISSAQQREIRKQLSKLLNPL